MQALEGKQAELADALQVRLSPLARPRPLVLLCPCCKYGACGALAHC
jgi:hypothetical protein